jgi:hypothetical protein
MPLPAKRLAFGAGSGLGFIFERTTFLTIPTVIV